MSNPEDHRCGGAVLIAVSVDLEPKCKLLRVGDFIPRHKPWSHRTKSVRRFSLDPLSAALKLKFAFRQIIDDAVARDMAKRIRPFYVTCILTNHYTEFHLPVGLF